MRVLIVEPGQYPREAEIEPALKAEQAVVGGLIDVVCPWPDRVCMVINDEGKLIPLPENRYLPEINDIVFGTFFLCGDAGDTFCDLTDRQVRKYLQRFKAPELFCFTPAGLIVQRCSPKEYQERIKAKAADAHPQAPKERMQR